MDSSEIKGSKRIKRSLLYKYLLVDKRPYAYYGVDLTKEKLPKDHPIVEGCKVVEESTWKPQEEFYEYMKKRDYLIFVTYKNEVIAFALGSAWIEDNYGMFSGDEVMIKPEFQGKKLSKKIALLAIHLLCRYYSKTGKVTQLIGLGTSCNPKMMLLLYKYRYFMLETTFNPKKTLKKIAEQYIAHHNYMPLHEDNPFFIKGLFPGSHKKLDPIEKEHIILHIAPPDFDYVKRGDCMLLMGRHYIKIAKFLTTLAVIALFGFEGINYNNPGWMMWEPKNSPLANSYTLQ